VASIHRRPSPSAGMMISQPCASRALPIAATAG
jgi:hypothetical protein